MKIKWYLVAMLTLFSQQGMAGTVVIRQQGIEPDAYTTAKVIYSGDVNSQGVMELMTSLDEINVTYPGVSTINLYINSGGGKMADGYMAYEAIKNSSVPVTTINAGEVASAATLMYCGGKDRRVFTAATFLLHASSTSNYYGDNLDANDLDLLKKNVEMGNDYFRYVYLKCTIFNKDEIEKALYTEGAAMYIKSKQAVAFGISSGIASGIAPADISYYITPEGSND